MSLILLLLALLAGQTIQGGSVEGIVVKEGTNEPVRGAEVRLGIGPSASNSVSTDDNGKFKFQNVPPGNYAVGVTHSNYLFGAFGQRGPNRPGLPVAIAAGQEIRNIVIRLTPRSALYGRVFGPTGEPARNIKVQLLRHLYIDGRRMLAIERDAMTGDAGEYRFADVAPQEYVVSAEFRDRGLPGYLPGTPVYYPGTVDPDGAATMNVLPGMEYGGLDLTLVKRDELRIAGHAIDAVTGTPPAAFFVMLAPSGRRTLIAGDTAPRKIPVARDGSFVVDGVAPGFYDLIATVDDGAERHSARVPLNVRANVDDLQLALKPGFAVRGIVTTEGAITEKPLSGMMVELLHEPYITQVNPRRAEVQADGSFSFAGVMPGDYRVRIATKFNAYVVYARLGGADILNSAVRVAADNANLIDIRVKPNVSTLEMNVFDDRSTAANGVQVVLVPADPNRARLELYETAQTDSFGHALLSNIEPGLYKAFAWEYLESGKWQDADFIRLNEHLGTMLRIGENAAERINLRLLPAVR